MNTPSGTEHKASCRCGAVSLTAKADPVCQSYCHCDDCRKQTGAPVTAFVGFKEADLVWNGALKIYRHGPVERGFCADCGTGIGYRDDRLPGEIYFYIGFMEKPENYPPTQHAFSPRRLPFLHIEDDLPRFAEFSVERQPQSDGHDA